MNIVPDLSIKRLSYNQKIDLINRVINKMSDDVEYYIAIAVKLNASLKNAKYNTYSKQGYDEHFDETIKYDALITSRIEMLDECIANIERIKEQYKIAKRGYDRSVQLRNNAYLETNTLQSIAKKTIKDHGIVPTEPEEIMALQPEQVYSTEEPTGGRKKTRKTRRKKRKSNK
jgi:hypothetical protein